MNRKVFTLLVVLCIVAVQINGFCTCKTKYCTHRKGPDENKTPNIEHFSPTDICSCSKHIAGDFQAYQEPEYEPEIKEKPKIYKTIKIPPKCEDDTPKKEYPSDTDGVDDYVYNKNDKPESADAVSIDMALNKFIGQLKPASEYQIHRINTPIDVQKNPHNPKEGNLYALNRGILQLKNPTYDDTQHGCKEDIEEEKEEIPKHIAEITYDKLGYEPDEYSNPELEKIQYKEYFYKPYPKIYDHNKGKNCNHDDEHYDHYDHSYKPNPKIYKVKDYNHDDGEYDHSYKPNPKIYKDKEYNHDDGEYDHDDDKYDDDDDYEKPIAFKYPTKERCKVNPKLVCTCSHPKSPKYE